MANLLTPKEIVYNFELENINLNEKAKDLGEYNSIYDRIGMALDIKDSGFNLYLVDDYSVEKVSHLKKFVESSYLGRKAPKDICYVVYEDEKEPKCLFIKNGYGNKLKMALEKLQSILSEITYKFYNSTNFEDKEDILDGLHRNRSELIEELVEKSKEEGFDIKATSHGFAFLPLKKEGETMTTKEYDELDMLLKDDILQKVGKLKIKAELILEDIKDMEDIAIEEVKKIYDSYLREYLSKCEYISLISGDKACVKYIEYVEDILIKSIVDLYTGLYDEDEEKLSLAIYKYNINVLVDNSENKKPIVYFEQDPTLSNLIGAIEYENHNGTYVTDISMINAGSLLKANNGVLILRLIDILSNPGSYFYLKKALLMGKVNFDYHRSYLEMLSLSGLKTEDIEIDVKVILIGDYQSYDILYSYDEDFKKIFGLKVESNSILDKNNYGNKVLIRRINSIIDKNKLYPLAEDGYKELAKALSRKIENRDRFILDGEEIKKVLNIANIKAKNLNKDRIDREEIIEATKQFEIMEEENLRMYKDKKILIEVDGQRIGTINALSVVGTEYFSFGRPMRVTCVCYKGSGEIIDVQRESKLSGNIHEKSLNILKAYISTITDKFKEIPLNFHLSFEQVYGKIDGDSASVAETICMISALCGIPIRQNISVTGSINQFGEIQPIGGVNEKIEGFFNVCKTINSIEGKGVLIPYSNVDNLVLNEEVEKAIKENKFSIYTMETIEDAVEILMGEEYKKNIFKKVKMQVNKFREKKEKTKRKEEV